MSAVTQTSSLTTRYLNDNCPICLDVLGNIKACKQTPCCNKYMHKTCMRKALHSRGNICSLCNQDPHEGGIERKYRKEQNNIDITFNQLENQIAEIEKMLVKVAYVFLKNISNVLRVLQTGLQMRVNSWLGLSKFLQNCSAPQLTLFDQLLW